MDKSGVRKTKHFRREEGKHHVSVVRTTQALSRHLYMITLSLSGSRRQWLFHLSGTWDASLIHHFTARVEAIFARNKTTFYPLDLSFCPLCVSHKVSFSLSPFPFVSFSHVEAGMKPLRSVLRPFCLYAHQHTAQSNNSLHYTVHYLGGFRLSCKHKPNGLDTLMCLLFFCDLPSPVQPSPTTRGHTHIDTTKQPAKDRCHSVWVVLRLQHFQSLSRGFVGL